MGSCGVCGHEFSTDAKFCPDCGQSRSVQTIDLVDLVDLSGDSSSPARFQDEAGSTDQDDASGRRRLSFLLVGLAAVVVLAALVLPGLSGASSQQAREPATPTPMPDEPPTVVPLGDASDTEPEADGIDAAEVEVGNAAPQYPPAIVAPLVASDLQDAELPPEVLVIVSAPSNITLLDLTTGEHLSWDPPEPLVDEDPTAVGGAIVVVGETQAWARSLAAEPGAESGWEALGLADRVRFSTKDDRVWLRRPNPKERPSDAEFLWKEVDLGGVVQRTMFRDREIYFPTPELVAGIGGDLFRLTDADINAWRLFSPYGVLIATGHNDLIVKECNNQRVCERVWYDTHTGEKRQSVYADLAQEVQTSYGARLSLDGRFVYSQVDDGGTAIRSVATGEAVPNNCAWASPIAWATNSAVFVCTVGGSVVLSRTDGRPPLGAVDLGIAGARPGDAVDRFVFVPTES